MNKSKQTIEDFGDQWTNYRANDGYYASKELFIDISGNFIKDEDVSDAVVADIGSGTGRIVNMLLDLGAKHVTAYEPSAAYEVLKENVKDKTRATLVKAAGDKLNEREKFDLIVSFGVLHHIPDPQPVVASAHSALKPGGRILIWLYGREGNRLYLALVTPLRAITTRIPHVLLALIVRLIDIPLVAYMAIAKFLPVPMAKYMNNHVAKLSDSVRRLTIYDQLNPTYSKYYTEQEAKCLLSSAGFENIQTHHRHGYSWTVIGTRQK